MVLFEKDQLPDLQSFLSELLKSLSEADPDILSEYVIVMLQNDLPEHELYNNCLTDLQDFLSEETESFVEFLFSILKSKKYLDKDLVPLKIYSFFKNSNNKSRNNLSPESQSSRTRNLTATSDNRSKSPSRSSNYSRRENSRHRRSASRSGNRHRESGLSKERQRSRYRDDNYESQNYKRTTSPQFRSSDRNRHREDYSDSPPIDDSFNSSSHNGGHLSSSPNNHDINEPYDPEDPILPSNDSTGDHDSSYNSAPANYPHPNIPNPAGFQQIIKNMPNQNQFNIPLAMGMPVPPNMNPHAAIQNQQNPQLFNPMQRPQLPFNRPAFHQNENIPVESLNRQAISTFFSKFGEIESIDIDIDSKSSLIIFKNPSDGYKAFKSPDAILGNRFVKIRKRKPQNINTAKSSSSLDEKIQTMPLLEKTLAIPTEVPQAFPTAPSALQTKSTFIQEDTDKTSESFENTDNNKSSVLETLLNPEEINNTIPPISNRKPSVPKKPFTNSMKLDFRPKTILFESVPDSLEVDVRQLLDAFAEFIKHDELTSASAKWVASNNPGKEDNLGFHQAKNNSEEQKQVLQSSEYPKPAEFFSESIVDNPDSNEESMTSGRNIHSSLYYNDSIDDDSENERHWKI
ncbi:hypothetical protein BB560_004220 [Smittium megazygosporum]|uniref:RRM domain-containing protein n=1 Tax=Smittium megazygosporum TaxID=133381 RepID=A0A2T9Z9S8_9FUNG|nr:hypothetical protein BB560_004220 [Smittium megazygosporum]